jgi:dTDP-4-amino-4,6-dideoxygalactose transaminase
MREIGSEFWLEREPAAISQKDGCYVLSGRTAIDLIIQDIAKARAVRKVYMPAWGCVSMLAPFSHRNIHVDFYDVRFDGQLKCYTESTESTEILYVTNYFGYENTLDIDVVRQLKTQGTIILYDRTHSFLMDNDPYLELADYSFASIRKWTGVIGGAVVDGVKDYHLKPYPHLACKEKAMRMKQAYMAGDNTINKQEFLSLYGEFGHHLAEDYCDYAMDDLSYAIFKTTDIEAMKALRRANAQYLHEHLKGVRFMFELTDKAVPLFVPIFFDTTEHRNAVRKKLIEAQIYCPIHWPKPAQIPADFEANKIYDTELSLICDQRYTTDDMASMVNVINEQTIKQLNN